jgi:hypothetical protein
MSRPLTIEEMIEGDPRRILMEEAARHSTRPITFSADSGYTCADHPELAKLGVYIGITAQADCPMCWGGDDSDVCHDFCPVCEFCCGC